MKGFSRELAMFILGLLLGNILTYFVLVFKFDEHWKNRCIEARVAEYTTNESGETYFRFLTEHKE